MDYREYFQPQQKVLLRILAGSTLSRTEVLSASLDFCSKDYFDLSLPYRMSESASALFKPGTDVSIISTAKGMGVQVDARLLKQLDAASLRLVPSGALEIFGQRRFLRADLPLRYGVVRQETDYESVRRQWREAVQAAHAGSSTLPQAVSLMTREVSLGAGGVGIRLPGPAGDGEVMLVLLDLDDGEAPIWALGEVVRNKPSSEDGLQELGIRFNDIASIDQERIDRLVTERLRQEGHDVEWYDARANLLEKVLF